MARTVKYPLISRIPRRDNNWGNMVTPLSPSFHDLNEGEVSNSFDFGWFYRPDPELGSSSPIPQGA